MISIMNPQPEAPGKIEAALTRAKAAVNGLRLLNALTKGNEAKAVLLIKNGAPIGQKTWVGRDTLLLIALSHGMANAAEALLKRGADPNETNSWKDTPLIFAIKENLESTVTALLEKGADPEKTNRRETPLLAAIRNRNLKTVTMLLGRGAGAAKPGPFGNLPLLEAARTGDVEIINLLLERGADPAGKLNKKAMAAAQGQEAAAEIFRKRLEGFRNAGQDRVVERRSLTPSLILRTVFDFQSCRVKSTLIGPLFRTVIEDSAFSESNQKKIAAARAVREKEPDSAAAAAPSP